jgi:hypothetical protein
VNPFNPCLPHMRSRTCLAWLDVNEAAFAPFDESKITPTNKYYFIWN